MPPQIDYARVQDQFTRDYNKVLAKARAGRYVNSWDETIKDAIEEARDHEITVAAAASRIATTKANRRRWMKQQGYI